MRPILIFFILLLCFTAPAQAANFNFESATLDNGMQIVVIPNHRMPIVTHMVWYKVGAMDETTGKSGLAHFLEHLMFKGTRNVPAGEFSKRIAAIGGNENAFTNTDYTAYFQSIAKENLPMVMKLEADRMQHLQLAEADFSSEKKVILEERKSRIDNDPSAILREEMMAALFRNHPYGRPLIGWEQEIASLTRNDAMNFYKSHYAPNNAILVVAGDTDMATVKPLAEDYFGDADRNKKIASPARIVEPPQRIARALIYQNSKIKQRQYLRMIAAPGLRDSTNPEISYALEVLAELLAGNRSGILYKNLAIDRKIALGVSSYYEGDKRGPAVFSIAATPAPKTDPADLGQAIQQIIVKIAAKGVSEQDLNRSKQSLLAEAIYARDSNFRMAYLVGETLTQGGSLDEIEQWPAKISAVTVDDIKLAAQSIAPLGNSVEGWLLPASATAPPPDGEADAPAVNMGGAIR